MILGVTMKDVKKIFNQILKELSEKELREFINKHCRTNVMQNKFLTHFSHKIEGKAEEKFQVLIDNSIKACTDKRGHFLVNPAKTNSALKPLFKMLEKEKNAYHKKPYESYLLAKLILENFVELYIDFYEVYDTDKLDNLFYEALELIDDICQASTTPHEFKEEVSKELLALSMETHFDKSSSEYGCDVDLDILKIASEIIAVDESAKLMEIINKKINKKDKYARREFIEFKLEVLEKYQMYDALTETIEENMDEENVRDMAIEKALKQKNIDKAIAYIEEGIELFTRQNLRGLVSKYEKKLLKVYKNNQMKEEHLSLLWRLYKVDYSGEYYDFLAKEYSEKEWKKYAEAMIDEIKTIYAKGRYAYDVSEKLADIYVKEKMVDALFLLIKENESFEYLKKYGRLCREKYSAEILAMYEVFLLRSFKHKGTRKEYAQYANLIHNLVTVFDGGEEMARKIHMQIKQKYANRPALLEEMSILDYLDATLPPKKVVAKCMPKEQKSLF